MYRHACLIALLSLGACADMPHRLTQAPPLTRSALCEVGGDMTVGRPSAPPEGSMRMNNDGGWCWMMNSATAGGNQYGPFLKVTVPPNYGELAIAVLETQTRLAYKPKPGFIGEDAFQTVVEPANFKVDYRVMVTR